MITNIDIPSKVQKIEAHTFYGCTNLKILNIPSDSRLTSIESEAFYNCGITIFKIGLTTPPKLNYNYVEGSYNSHRYAFDSKTFSNCTVKVPVGYLDIYKESRWNTFTKITEE